MKVDEKYTSQHCPVCGNQLEKKYKFSYRVHICSVCGFICHRDKGSGQNMANCGISKFYENERPRYLEYKYEEKK